MLFMNWNNSLELGLGDLVTNKVNKITLCLLNIQGKRGNITSSFVDDIVGTGNNEKEKEVLKQRLVQEFN